MDINIVNWVGEEELSVLKFIAGSILVPALTAFAVYRTQRTKLEREYQLQYRAEAVVQKLLSEERWKYRTFSMIKKRVGGFEDDELRKILVQAGAVRFYKKDGSEELWGKYERVSDEI